MEKEEQEAGSEPLLQGEAELAYLTHEGLFISDALHTVQQTQQPAQQPALQDQGSATGSRVQPGRAEPEPSFTYVKHTPTHTAPVIQSNPWNGSGSSLC